MSYLFNKALIREQLKRYWMVAALSFLAYFLFILLGIINSINSGNPAASYTVESIINMQHPLIIMMTVLVPLIVAVLMFSYQFNGSAAVAVHSLPLTKKQLFLSKTLAGWLLIVAPLAVFTLIFMVLRVNEVIWIDNQFGQSLMVQGDVINTVPAVLLFFVRTVISFTFYYAVFVLAAAIAGNTVMYLLVSLALNGILTLVWGLYNLGAYYYIMGHRVAEDLLVFILAFTHPVSMAGVIGAGEQASFSVNRFADTFGGIPVFVFFIVYAVLTAALFALSYLLYHRRKLERAGDSIVFAPVRHALLFLASAVGMISMGMLFIAVTVSHPVAMYIGFVLGFALAFLIAQMIFERTFKVFHILKPIIFHGGAVVAVIALFNVANAVDITGRIRFVPNESDVYAVLSANMWWEFDGQPDERLRNAMMTTDRDFINRTISAHEYIIHERRLMRQVFLSNLFRDYRPDLRYYRFHSPMREHIVYLMNDGSVVMREFLVGGGLAQRSGFWDLRLSDEARLVRYYWMHVPEAMREIEINIRIAALFEDDELIEESHHARFSIVNRAHIAEFLEAAWRDVLVFEEESVSFHPDEIPDDFVPFEPPRINVIVTAIPEMSGNRRTHSRGFGTFSENVLQWLAENGYFTS